MWGFAAEVFKGIGRWFTHNQRMEQKLDTLLQHQKDIELRVLRLEVLQAIQRKDAVTACSLMKDYKERNGNYYLDKVFADFMKKWKKSK